MTLKDELKSQEFHNLFVFGVSYMHGGKIEKWSIKLGELSKEPLFLLIWNIYLHSLNWFTKIAKIYEQRIFRTETFKAKCLTEQTVTQSVDLIRITMKQLQRNEARTVMCADAVGSRESCHRMDLRLPLTRFRHSSTVCARHPNVTLSSTLLQWRNYLQQSLQTLASPASWSKLTAFYRLRKIR